MMISWTGIRCAGGFRQSIQNGTCRTGILAGDVLYARAFEFISQAKAGEGAKVRAVTLLARACADICEGQHMDMSFEHRTDVTEDEYMKMVEKKTGVLYAAAAAIGGTLAGGNEQQVKALYQFGLNTGIAFQIQDDLIDLLTHWPRRAARIRVRISGKENRP